MATEATLQNPTETAEQDYTPPEKAQSQETPKESGPKFPEGIQSEGEWLTQILEKETKVGNGLEKFTEDELDILDKHYAGKLDPSEKKPKTEPENKEEGDKKPENKEENPDKKFEVDKETIKKSSSIDLAVMKEVGAKSKSEILEKVKGLRRAVSGKVEVAPQFIAIQEQLTTLRNVVEADRKHWRDIAAGVPEAISHAKQHYGVDFGAKGKEVEKTSEDILSIPADKFIDEEAAKAVNSVLASVGKKFANMEKKLAAQEEANLKREESLAEERAQVKITDEMVRVASHIPGLKDVQNIREAIVKWRDGGEDDRMEYFRDLMEIANKEKVNLLQALEIDKGRKADLAIVEAREEERKVIYSQKPNKSLSDTQGRTVEKPEEYSEADVKKMVQNGKMPDNWFDKNDDPDPNKIPKHSWHYFWPEGVDPRDF